MRIRSGCFALLVLLAAAGGRAEVYSVTNAAEFNALPPLNAGDRVILADGTYGALDKTLVSSIDDDATAQTSPVVVCARTPGGAVIAAPSQITLSGCGIVLAGLDFGSESGMLDNGAGDPAWIIRTAPDSRYMTLTNLRFKDCASGDDYGNWLAIYGFNHTIEYCSFEGKDEPIANATVIFKRDLSESGGVSVPRNHLMRRCWFGPREVSTSDNGYETVRIGDSSSQAYEMAVTLEENVFYRSVWRSDGEENNDLEIISNKSAGNVYRRNLFLESFGQLTLRHGDRATVEENRFVGSGRFDDSGEVYVAATNSLQGGVRIIGQDHIIRGNWFQNLQGGSLRAAICLMGGEADFDDGDGTYGDSGYEPADGAQIAGNTFVDCEQMNLGMLKSGSELPQGVQIVSNVWKGCGSNAALVREDGFEAAVSADNVIYEPNGAFGWTGLTNSVYTSTKEPAVSVPSFLNRADVGPEFDGGPAGTSPRGGIALSEWYLQLPVDDTGGFDGEARVVSTEELAAGFELEPWFYSDVNGALIFEVPWNGAVLGTSTSPRCELRETWTDGSLRNWLPREDGGVHTLDAVCTVESVGSGKVAIGQIHGKVPDVPTVIMRYDNTVDPAQIAVSVYETPDGLNGKQWLYYDAPALGEAIVYQMKMVASSTNALSFSCTVNGETQSLDLTNSVAAWMDAAFYFKAGAYYTIPVSGETARVSFSSLDLSRGEAPEIVPAILSAGVKGTVYSQVFEASAGNDAVWTLTGGVLPAGLFLSSGGTLSGTPEESGIFSFTVDLNTESGQAERTFHLAIDESSEPSLSVRSVLAVEDSGNDGNLPENTLDGSL
ncbi:MAG: chondroitinase-B domain-containing protein, partial [Kiritimatiellales bacterium]